MELSGSVMLRQIRRLVELIAVASSERSTLLQLIPTIDDRVQRKNGHSLFASIRTKTLAAELAGDHVLESQYLFEEACAKTLFNLTGPKASFDADSPYFIVPCAFVAARRLGIADAEVIDAIFGNGYGETTVLAH